MKYLISIVIFLLTFNNLFAQNQENLTSHRKGDFYLYWGWNWSWYNKSDIRFEGENYDFTLEKVRAKDRQSTFDWGTYFNPSTATIPQYNVRIGYFISDKYNISIGTDHMKYVAQQGQTVKITGSIAGTDTEYDGVYANEDITIQEGFLQYEHTDGLNYPNIELRRLDELVRFNKISINLIEGFGVGVLLPRTNATLLNNQRYDEFHLSGYGMGAVLGVNVSVGKAFFFQSEWKGGFINMSDIRTTNSELDKASQKIFFSQLNIIFGATLKSKKHNK
ncbi:MAG: hypothetical protein AB8B69_20895 [Chitinophagales bacterium]